MDNRRKVYIGQTHNLIERLIQHDAHKEYWTYAMCFTTDDVLDKTDTAYLEYLFIKEFIECGCIGLLQNYQVPVEPIIKESSKEILMEKFRYMKLLLEFSGFRLLSNKVLEVGDISQKNSRRLMDRIVRSYSKMNNNDITDEDEHDECEKFVLNGEDFYAEVITLKDGRYMVLPFGFISKWASLDYIEKKFGENVVDKKTRKLKKEIILDNLNNLGTIITGFYVNPENIKKVVGH